MGWCLESCGCLEPFEGAESPARSCCSCGYSLHHQHSLRYMPQDIQAARPPAHAEAKAVAWCCWNVTMSNGKSTSLPVPDTAASSEAVTMPGAWIRDFQLRLQPELSAWRLFGSPANHQTSVAVQVAGWHMLHRCGTRSIFTKGISSRAGL